jgi:hypothetical protein
MSDAMRRAVLIIGVLAILVGIGIADGTTGGSAATGSSAGGALSSVSASTAATAASGTSVTPTGAESSAWFCAGSTGNGGNAGASMIITNPSPRAVTGTVTTVSTVGTVVPMTVPVPAKTQLAVTPAAPTAPTTTATANATASTTTAGPGESTEASTVVFSGGGVGVTQVVNGPLGFSQAPCASKTARHWYFADGSTATGDTLSLSLFNPTDTVSVVNVTFVSSTGVLAPPAYQGIDIPGGSLVTENIGDHVLNSPDVATEVAALSGQVVASELESAGPAGSGGPSVVLGATAPSRQWSFAQNTEVSNGSTVFHIFNPSTRTARVTVKIGLQQGAAEPLVLRVPGQSVSTLDTKRLTRIPVDTPFAVTFEAGGGAGIVVDRHGAAPAGTASPGAGAPDVGDVAGVPGGARRWLVPGEYTPVTGVTALAVVDLNSEAVSVKLMTVSASGLVPVPGFGVRRVRSGLPLVVSPATGSPIGTVPLEIVASGPVAVEVDAGPAGSPGVIVTPALPLG